MACEHNSELATWGLRLLDDDEEDRNNMIHIQVEILKLKVAMRENYQTIAHTLQEELSQLAVTEPSEFNDSQQNSESVYQQDRHNPLTEEYYIGQEHGGEDGNAVMVPSSFSCGIGEKFRDGEKCPHSLELMGGSGLDGEVGKRLNQMISIPHVPKINGDIHLSDDATSDYERLVHRLKVYNLVELKVKVMAIVSFVPYRTSINRTPEHHNFVRQQIVKQLQSRTEIYQGYVPMPFGEYLKKMSKSGKWGDHLTLQAATDSYGIKIVTVTSLKDTCYIEILPEVQKSNRFIFLRFWAEVYYNSIYPGGDTDSDIPLLNELKKKKRWWSKN